MYVQNLVALYQSDGLRGIEQLATAVEQGLITPDSSPQAIGQKLRLTPAGRIAAIRLINEWVHDAASLSAGLLMTVALVRDSEAKQTHAQPVMTLGDLPGSPLARRVASVAESLIDAARFELIVVTYALTEGAEFLLRRVIAAQKRGVKTQLILDEGSEKVRLLKVLWGSTPLPEIYVLAEGSHLRTLHAKVILRDREEALIGSANVTWSGMRNNLEMGALLKGPSVASFADALHDLIRSGILVGLEASNLPI